MSPQQYLDKSLLKRGYSTQTYSTLRTAYHAEPTKLQRASYDVHILKAIVRDRDEEALRELLSCGISPNACNKYGESLLHKVCKSGHTKLLQVFLECGVNVQVSDGAGRTPLHNACWKSARPSFETFELVLKQDPSMIFLKDYTGALPLAYVRKSHYTAWSKFLKSILDVYWPPMSAGQQQQLSVLMSLPANSRPIVDPEDALPIKLAKMVASGRMDPDDAMNANGSDGETDWDEESSVMSAASHHCWVDMSESESSESGSIGSVSESGSVGSALGGTSDYGVPGYVSGGSALGGCEFDEETEEENIFEFTGLDQLAGFEDLMGKKHQQAVVKATPSSARITM
jgi:hypothetical protein